ncbi:MAG TPA: ABC transporter permease [Bryobacteraceae bacterium]|jgi:putative ABC transport system permease protein
MAHNLVYAYRILRKSPLATAVTILALALGIGANIGSFIAVNAIVLHPFAYPDLDRIETVWETELKSGVDRAGIAAANFEDWRKAKSFETLAVYDNWTVNLTGADRPEPLVGARVGSGFFQVFGMKPSQGRTFAPGEEESGDARVAVVSNALWHTRFAAADIAGKTISLGGQNYTVVGVMPEDFDFPLAANVWVPLTLTPAQKADRVYHSLMAVGKLKAGVKNTEADAELRTIAAGLGREYPKTNEGWSASVTPLRSLAENVTNRFLEVLFVASLFLLLLAAANVANIQLAQAVTRRKTIVIEASLGATRFQIARSLSMQSVMLSLAGGAAAMIGVVWMNELNRVAIPAVVYQIVPGLKQIRIDSTVILFTLGLSVVTGVLCGLPAIYHLLGRRSAPALTEALGQGNRSVAGDSHHRMRNLLVMGEMAMALLLLVGAGVMVNTFQRMLVLNVGFNPAHLLTAQISLPQQAYPGDAQITGFYDRLLGELATIPGVQSASLQMDDGAAADFKIEGHPDLLAGDPKPDIRIVGPQYLRTMELPLLAGRMLAEQDRAGSLPVIVISKSMAERYWPGTDPIGHRVRFGLAPWLTIVGVTGDTIQWFTNQPEHAAYTSFQQKPILSARMLLRTAGDPALAEKAVVARVRAVDSSEPVYEIKTMERFFFEQRSGVQQAARAMEQNAGIALFLALTGIYGVIAYFVSQRTREIGIRIAVGATTSDILKLTLGEAVRVAGIGLAIGVPAAYLLMRVLSSALYNVVVVKWTTFSGVTVLLATAALLAAYFPARRAAKVDPVVALRNE